MTACGLVKTSQEPVPLQSISVDVVVQGFVADVVSELRYKNEEKNPVEVTFVFPLDDEAAVYAFEGLIGGTRIEAQIREKKEAQQEYEDALSEGRQAFLLERETNTSDIFTCTLGNLPPNGEAVLKVCYVQALAPEPDGAVRFVLPAVLNPRYVPVGSESDTVTQHIPRVPKGKLPYTLSLCATLESSYGISRVESKCTLEPLRYTVENRTSAQVSLAEGHQFDRDVELLIYYEEVHKPSAVLEAGKPGAASDSLMGDPVLLVTLYPSWQCAPKPGLSATGEFIFLLDRSGSMDCCSDYNTLDAPPRIQSAKETLILLLKGLPLGCFFNIYGFGSTYDSFYPKSVEYTQKTMSESLQRVKNLGANLGGTEILQPLKAIYSQPCREGHPRQLFVFTDGEVSNTNEVIAEVQHHSDSHRCFSFGIGEGASTTLIKGIARVAGGSAEFITGKERMQAKALQSLKKALQPAATGISLQWDLPSHLEAVLVGSGPQVIFEGQHSLIYAQIRGQHKSSGASEGSVVLQYIFQGQTFTETMKFPLKAQESDRLPVHRLAARALLQDLEGTGVKDGKKQRLALQTSLSSGVVCSQTAYVGVNTEKGQPVQGPLIRRNVPLIGARRGPRPIIVTGASQYDRLCYGAPLPPVLSRSGPSSGQRCNKITFGSYGFERITGSSRDEPRLANEYGFERITGSSRDEPRLANEYDCFAGIPIMERCVDNAFSLGTDLYERITLGRSEKSRKDHGICKVYEPAHQNGALKSFKENDKSNISPNICWDAIKSVLRAPAKKKKPIPKKEESPLLRLVSLQNADGSWDPDSNLASLLGLSEAKIMRKTPKQVAPNVWATVLAILWLHSNVAEQRDEWELLEGKALNWLQATAGSRLADCVKTGNAVLGSSVSPQTLGL